MKKLISILLILMMIPISSAYTVFSTTVSDEEIFKCQPSNINVVFLDSAGITNVNITFRNIGNLPMINGLRQYAVETHEMTYADGQASYTYGNDNTIIEGYKSITLTVKELGVDTEVNTGQFIRVYSDSCTGINKESYRNISSDKYIGGNNTNEFLNSGKDPLSVVLTYITNDTEFGLVIISFIIFIILFILYLNTKNIIYPLIFLVVSLSLFVGTGIIPVAIGTIAVVIVSIAIVGRIYKIYMKHG